MSRLAGAVDVKRFSPASDGASGHACLADLDLKVHASSRRAGLGTALLRHAAGRARDHGHTDLTGSARAGSPGTAFAHAAGAHAQLLVDPRARGVSVGHRAPAGTWIARVAGMYLHETARTERTEIASAVWGAIARRLDRGCAAIA
jgi:GNAT superfamily N-acetyltransferase